MRFLRVHQASGLLGVRFARNREKTREACPKKSAASCKRCRRVPTVVMAAAVVAVDTSLTAGCTVEMAMVVAQVALGLEARTPR